MNKSRNFSGHPIIKQVLNFILPQDVYRTAKKHQSDRYTKKFTTYEHLATMIFTVISGCSSLREVSNIMLACEGKINHIGLKDFPRRSTLSDANKRRSAGVFAAIYNLLYKRYHLFLSDSRPSEPAVKGLKIVDSSTITLFSDILKGVGRNPLNGKKKGGIKMHTMINAMEDVPCLIKFSSAATHDHTFLKELELKKGSYPSYIDINRREPGAFSRDDDFLLYENVAKFYSDSTQALSFPGSKQSPGFIYNQPQTGIWTYTDIPFYICCKDYFRKKIHSFANLASFNAFWIRENDQQKWLRIEIPEHLHSAISYTLIDIQGRTIKNSYWSFNNENEYSVQKPEVAGMYLLNIRTGMYSKTLKMIVP